MTYSEHKELPHITTCRFLETWQGINPNRLIAELISVNNETHRNPDPYHFSLRQGKLIDPETGKPITDFISDGVELEVVLKLQDWANKKDAGLAYWVSPRLVDVYPSEKLIIHRIAYTLTGEKIVLNSAILFEAELDNPETLRDTLFESDDTEENILKLLAWVQEVSGEAVNLTSHKTHKDQAQYFAKQIINGVDHSQIIQEMLQTGFLGEFSISCKTVNNPASFSNYILSRAAINSIETSEGKYVEKCGNCGKEIKAVIRKGYKCSCGGVYEGC